MMLRRSCTWNLKPSGMFMNFEIKSCNGILLVMNDGIRVDSPEKHHIILRNFIMMYLCPHCKVALEDLCDRVNVIGL